jgi:hypothetical protein
MNAIGLFAGRGDVILSMLLALVFGCWLGWQLNNFYAWIKSKAKQKSV